MGGGIQRPELAGAAEADRSVGSAGGEIFYLVQTCVRQANLLGWDPVTGTDHSHRVDWVHRRIAILESGFAIDVLGCEVESNRVHLVLRRRPELVVGWTDTDVARRWLRVFPGNRQAELSFSEPDLVSVGQLAEQVERMKDLRGRLCDIAWFMREFSAPLARLANREDGGRGPFWDVRRKPKWIREERHLSVLPSLIDRGPIEAALADRPLAGSEVRFSSADTSSVDSASAAVAGRRTSPRPGYVMPPAVSDRCNKSGS